MPAQDGVYTIRAILETASGLGLLLDEVRNPIGNTGWETGFELRRFRPVVTRDHEAEDLATFREWLRVDQPESVDA